jgi:hypothetical protein
MKTPFQKISYTLAIGALLGLQACDEDFEEMNTNPDASTRIVPEYVFSSAQIDAARNLLGGAMGAMQYTTSYNDVAGFGSKYIFNQGTAPHTVFNNAYPREINEIGEVIRALEADPNSSNKLAAARIWRVYAFHRVTDLYGDIPYFEAGLGYTKSNYKPTYDAQEDIYKDMLKELDEAAVSFDPAKTTFGAADVVYGGDVGKWKKFAYSLMLRLGMRLTKVDAALAETWVKKAIAGGVITDDADIALIKYTAAGQVINQNPLAYSLLQSDYLQANGNTNPEGGKYQEYFINYLKANNDPRLGVLSVVYVNGKADTAFALQKGMPANFRNTKPADFGTYSEPNQSTLLRLDSPLLLLTPAEVNLLLAEAAVRGWYSGQTAGAVYANGVRAGLRQWALFGPAGAIATDKIETYVAGHPFKTDGSIEEQMDQIHTQFWVAVFPDAQEVFANWRRTGYPALVPNVVPGNSTGGEIFRRMVYPPTEENLNNEAYQQAISRQGENTFLTRIWWDKQ